MTKRKAKKPAPRKRVYPERWTVSVSRGTYRTIEALAIKHGLTLKGVVEAACSGVQIDPSGVPIDAGGHGGDRTTHHNAAMCADCVAEEAGV
jgi:hypothetical protein